MGNGEEETAWNKPMDDDVDELLLGVGVERVLTVLGFVVMAGVFAGVLMSL